jgi:hypothetical protein
VLVEEDVSNMSIMNEVVNEVAVSITNDTHPDVHPGLYSTVMDATGFSTEAKMVALSYLFNNRAQRNGFVQMVGDHRLLWLRTYLTMHFYV